MKCFGEKVRNIHCKIVRLDDQELIQEIQSTSNGQCIMDNVFKHLNIIETAYFGLRFIDKTGQAHWLDPGKRVIKQLEGTEPYTLYFGVKFYTADPCKMLREEITRYQFFMQIKQDILQGRLPVPFELSTELAAYSVQSELGDYDPRRHLPGYVSEFRFVAGQSADFEEKVAELHKTMAGMVPAVAELNFLEKVKWLEMHGSDLHIVKGEDNVDYFLGLTPSGVIVLRNKTKVGNYFWPRISKFNRKGKYFMLRVKNKNNEEQTYGFETPSKSACKHLYRCCVEHLEFFRLIQLSSPTVTNSNKTYSLSARFRDSSRSGRSDTSMRRRAQPEFVRTPSRRYTRRIVEGQDNDDLKENNEIIITDLGHSVNKTISVPQPVVSSANMYRAPSQSVISVPQQQRSDSPRSTRSAPWPRHGHNDRKTNYSMPSPRSVRSVAVTGEESTSRKRSQSQESHSSVDSRSHSHHRRHRHRSRKGSDAESEISKSSGRSHHSRRRSKHGSSSRHRGGDSCGSDSENCRHRHKHRHNSRHSGKYQLIDSEVQWKEAQKKNGESIIQQAAVIRGISENQQNQNSQNQINPNQQNQNQTTVSTSQAHVRKSGYLNSGVDTGNDDKSEMSYHQKRRSRKSHRSRSPEKRVPDELKKHLDFQLIDTEGMSETQLREIPYKKVETAAIKSSKVRYKDSIKSNRSSKSNAQPQVTQDKNKNQSECLNPEKSELSNLGDSPPPPYKIETAPIIKSANKAPSIVQTHPRNPNSQSLQSFKPNTPVNGYNSGSGPTSATPQQNINNSRSQPQNLNKNGQLMPSFQYGLPPTVLPPTSTMLNGNSNGHRNNYTNGGSKTNGIDNNGNGTNGDHHTHHPSPSESPDSQKVDSHHENSDSGLGTDHQEQNYYRGEKFSSLNYTLSTNPTGVSNNNQIMNNNQNPNNPRNYSNSKSTSSYNGQPTSMQMSQGNKNPKSNTKEIHYTSNSGLKYATKIDYEWTNSNQNQPSNPKPTIIHHQKKLSNSNVSNGFPSQNAAQNQNQNQTTQQHNGGIKNMNGKLPPGGKYHFGESLDERPKPIYNWGNFTLGTNLSPRTNPDEMKKTTPTRVLHEMSTEL